MILSYAKEQFQFVKVFPEKGRRKQKRFYSHDQSNELDNKFNHLRGHLGRWYLYKTLAVSSPIMVSGHFLLVNRSTDSLSVLSNAAIYNSTLRK